VRSGFFASVEDKSQVKDRGADRASNDADVSSIPPIIPYGGFSPIRLEGWLFRWRLSDFHALKSAPDIRNVLASLHPPFVHFVIQRLSRTEPGRGFDRAPP
jgi:hypothetical protein